MLNGAPFGVAAYEGLLGIVVVVVLVVVGVLLAAAVAAGKLSRTFLLPFYPIRSLTHPPHQYHPPGF